MFKELNQNFLELVRNYTTSEIFENENVIDISEDFIANKIKLTSALLEYYINALLFQHNINIDDSSKKILRENYDSLIESYIALITASSNNNIRLNETLLDQLIQDSQIAKKLIEEKHNNAEILEKIFEEINEAIKRITEDIVRYKRHEVKQRLIESEDLTNMDRILVNVVLEKFIDELLLGALNRIAIDEYLAKTKMTNYSNLN